MQPPSSSSRDPASAAQSSDPVEQQLGRLYGDSLFGAWRDPLEAVVSQHAPRRGRWGKRLAVLLLLVVAGTAGVALYRRGVARRAAQERAEVAKDVATFLADGELDRLAQFLDVLLPPSQPLQNADPYRDLIVSAEAALFRYQDAAPARLARIEPFLSSPAHLLARLTVAARPERADAYERLAALGPALAKDPEYHTLMATVLEERRDAKAAAASWERSFQAGPLWLPHRYQQCAFAARQRDATAVLRITGHMAKVAPESAWTRLAFQHFTSTTPPPRSAAETAAPKPPSPVARYHAELAAVFASLTAKDLPASRQALGRALAAVQSQGPFVLDVFAALLAAKAEAMAMELTSYEAWPRANPWARSKLAELQAASAARAAAPTQVAAPDPESAKRPAAVRPAKHEPKHATAAKKKRGKTKQHGSRRRK
jgi:hypothetical protein